MLGKLTERVYRDQVWGSKWRLDARIRLIRRFPAGGSAAPFSKLEESEWPTVAAPRPLEPLFDDFRGTALLVDGKVIGNERLPGAFPILDLDDHRPILAAGLQLPRAAPPVPRMPQPRLEAFSEEVEDVEHGGLSTAVRTEEHGDWRDVLYLHRLEGPEVLDAQVCDARPILTCIPSRPDSSRLSHQMISAATCSTSFTRNSPEMSLGSSASRPSLSRT